MDTLFFPYEELQAAVDAISKAFEEMSSTVNEFLEAWNEIMNLAETYIEECNVPPKQYGISLIKPKHPTNQKLTYTYLRRFNRGLPYHRRIYTNN